MVKDMTEGGATKLILSFAVPLMLGNLLQQAYSLIDAAIVGHYLGMNALAAVGASTSVIFMIIGFCNGCTGGFGIPVAQQFGAGNYGKMRSFVYNAYFLVAVMSVLISAVTSLLCRQIMLWMQTPEDIFDDAYKYLLITFLGIPFTMIYNMLASIMRAMGDSRTPFWFLLVAAVLNVVLDIVFITVFGWGPEGAAAATVLSQGVSAALCWIYMHHGFPILRPEKYDEKLNRKNMLILCGMGVPMGLQFSITAIGSMMLQSSNNALGTVCVTAFTAAMRIKMFFICPFENLGVAMATYCGQNLGARKISRIWQGIKSSIGMAALYTAFTMVILYLFARNMTELFVYSYETEIIEKSVQFLHFSCLFYIVLGILCILRYSLQGVGFTKLSMMSGVFEMVARVFVSLWVVPALGFAGVCIGDPSAWIAAVVFLVPAMTFVYRKLLKRFPGRS